MPKHAKDMPVYCHKCGSENVTVSESQQRLTVHGKAKLHADVRCTHCGWRWWSRAKRALQQSRVKDAEAYTAANEKVQ